MNILSTHGGQQMDILFNLVGPPRAIAGLVQTQFSTITIKETGTRLPNTSTDEAMIIGSLERGGLFSVHVEGGNPRDAGISIDIAGTDGALRLTNPVGNDGDFVLHGAHGEQTKLLVLTTPEEYQLRQSPALPASVEDLVTLYQKHARDKTTEGSESPTFADAVALHRVLDRISQSSTQLQN